MPVKIDVVYSTIPQINEDLDFDIYAGIIPDNYLNKIRRYINFKDKFLSLTGILLLHYKLMKKGEDINCLERLQYNKYGKPYIEELHDFNISHSGKYSICCSVNKYNTKVGVDIQEHCDLSPSFCESILSSQEIQSFRNSNNPNKQFFDYWAIKESVVKGIGSGLSISFKNLKIVDNVVLNGSDKWFVKELNINYGYSCFVSSKCKLFDVSVEFIDFCKLVNMEHLI